MKRNIRYGGDTEVKTSKEGQLFTSLGQLSSCLTHFETII